MLDHAALTKPQQYGICATTQLHAFCIMHVSKPVQPSAHLPRSPTTLHCTCVGRVSAAFYLTCSWLAKDLRTYGYPLKMTQVKGTMPLCMRCA
jgi:hypothetical protein